MSYFGSYFGTGESVEEEEVELVPIPAAITSADPEYIDHATAAIARLPEQFKRRS